MNKNIQIYIRFALLTAAMLFSAGRLCAQVPQKESAPDTLRRELTVVTDRQINIPEEKGRPIRLSVLEPTGKSFKPNFRDFPGNDLPLACPFTEETLSRLGESRFLSGKKGYLTFGAGAMWNSLLNAGYRANIGERDRISIYAAHEGLYGDFEAEGIKAKTRVRRTADRLGFDFLHRFNAAVLGIHAGYRHRYRNYYGIIRSDNGATEAKTNKSSLGNGEHDVEIAVALKSNPNPEGRFSYNFDLSHRAASWIADPYSLKIPIAEHIPCLKMKLETKIHTDTYTGIDALAGIMSNRARGADPTQGKADRDLFFIGGAPYIRFEGGNGSVDYAFQAGAGMSYNTGDNSKLFFYPLLNASLSFARSYRFYIRSKGGFMLNNRSAVIDECPFILPGSFLHDRFFVDPARELLNGTLGFAAAISPRVGFDLYGGVRKVNHQYFLALAPMRPTENPSDPYMSDLAMIPCYGNDFVWSLGGRLKYDFRGIWSIDLGAHYEKHKPTGNPEAVSDAPILAADMRIEARPTDMLVVGLTYRLLHGRRCRDYISNNIKVLRDAQILDLDATFKFSETLGFFVRGRNLLFQTYSEFYGYPAQGTSVFIGCNINF